MKKVMITIFTSIILLLGVGLSYAYFTGMIFGEGKKLSISSANLRILFTDSQELSNLEIEPGWNQTKTFSVKNESDDTFNYNIVFENLVNTFVTEGFLQYKITSSSGYNMTGYLDIPKSSTPKTIALAYDIDIPKDITHEYTIEFVYHDSETVDQSDDMGKIFEGNLAIIEGTANPNIKYTVTMNSEHGTITPINNQVIKYENLEFSVTPDTGYDISTMSVSCTPVANTVITDNKIKVNDIRQDHDCTVNFDKETYTVNIVVNNGESDALNKKVEYGGDATAKITPDKGYTLEGATVEGTGCSIEGEILSISNIVSNGTCTVTLPREKYAVTLTGTGIETSDSPKTVEYEGETTIDFTLSEGYELGDNVINCDNGEPSMSGNTLTVSNVQDNTTCTLTPTLKSYEVTLVVNGGTPESETKSINHNGSGTYTITNDTGYKLELDGSISCTGNASGTLSRSIATISGVTTIQTCTLNLKKQTYTISVSVNDSTMGSVSPANSTVEHGDDLEVVITPNAGYKYSSNDCGLSVTNNKMTFKNVTEAKGCKVTFNRITLTEAIFIAYKSSGERNNFVNAYNSTRLFETVDYDNNKTYYFTGNPNNWVSFAGKMWRIIRINGNGSVRLLYAGTGKEDGFLKPSDLDSSVVSSVKMESTGGMPYNLRCFHPQCVGWKYTEGDSLEINRENQKKSSIYLVVENWFSKISTTNKKYIDMSAVYCNDRRLSTNATYDTNNAFDYLSKERLDGDSPNPSLSCNVQDQFRDGFGLMTADEVLFAGVGRNRGANSSSIYLYRNMSGGSSTGLPEEGYYGSGFWTMTPYQFKPGASKYAYNFKTDLTSEYYYIGTSNVNGILSTFARPVISLKSNTLVSGTGSATDPYVVQGLQ